MCSSFMPCLLASWRSTTLGLCPVCRTTVNRQDLITAPTDSRFQIDVEKNWVDSSKVSALLKELEKLRATGSKSIVFSQWTAFLDLLQIPLSRNNITFARLDGTLNQHQREKVISRFAEDKQIVVLLMSLKAGGVGLNLTAACSAFLLVGGRKVLLDLVAVTWADISHLINSSVASQNPLHWKYVVKLSQRIGLICLPHRPPSWHYVGNASSVGQNTVLSATGKNNLHSSGNQVVRFNDMPAVEIPEEENMDVPEIVEEIIEQLLNGLRDSDTVVRWSAAKGIG